MIRLTTATPVADSRSAWNRWRARLAPRGVRSGLGLWGPGVRVLRNLSLCSKAVLVAAFVGLPAGGLIVSSAVGEFEVYRASQQRLAGLRQIQALGEQARALTTLMAGAVQSELGAGGGRHDLAAEWAAEQRRYLAFAEASRAHLAVPEVAEALRSLDQRRQAMLAQAANASGSALPGYSGPRVEAIAAYARELTGLRRVIASGTNATAVAAPVRALTEVATRSLPELRWMVGLTVRIGARLHAADERSLSGERLALLAAQSRVLLEAIASDVGYASEQGLGRQASLDRALNAVRRQLDTAAALARASRTAEAAASLGDVTGVDRHAYLSGGSIALEQVDALDTAVLANLLAWGEAQAAARERRVLCFAALLFAWLLASSYLVICTYRVLSGGLKALGDRLATIGRGDFSRMQSARGRDEIGRALDALAASTGHMAQLFGAVTQGVAAVSQASREVAGGNAGLSARAGAMRELIAGVSTRASGCSASLRTCGEQVEQTAELIIGMRADGERSRKAMGGLRDGMARLQVKSQEVAQVVGLVEAVAYQTKLLSINASVEAARAGSAGRGFALVAQEVRALAVRSENAARRIHEIVGSSVAEIASGGLLADRAGTAVRSTEQRIEAVDGLMREAVRLTRSGRTETQEVLAISRSLEESITGDVRVIEQLAEASADLREQGDSLKRSVQHFVLG